MLRVAAGGVGRARPRGGAVCGAAPDAVADGADCRGTRMGGVVGDEKGKRRISNLGFQKTNGIQRPEGYFQ